MRIVLFRAVYCSIDGRLRLRDVSDGAVRDNRMPVSIGQNQVRLIASSAKSLGSRRRQHCLDRVYHDDERVLETFYPLRLKPMSCLQPDLKIVWNPAVPLRSEFAFVERFMRLRVTSALDWITAV